MLGLRAGVRQAPGVLVLAEPRDLSWARCGLQPGDQPRSLPHCTVSLISGRLGTIFGEQETRWALGKTSPAVPRAGPWCHWPHPFPQKLSTSIKSYLKYLPLLLLIPLLLLLCCCCWWLWKRRVRAPCCPALHTGALRTWP